MTGARHGLRYGLWYRVELAADWSFNRIELGRTDGRTFCLERTAAGQWLHDGNCRPDLDGCIDIDLSGSPFTNSLPIRRLEFEICPPKDFLMAWIPLDTLDPFVDEQRYTRLDHVRFRYESGSFRREITFDEHGLVVDYPGLFKRDDQ